MPEKKYVKEYQPVDSSTGEPIGPPQRFEADTKDELIELLANAHRNSSAKLYETKLAVKLGTLLTPDVEEPIANYDERPLTADEMVQVDELLRDPRTAPQAHKILLEAQFGVPIEKIRQNFRQTEVINRRDYMQEQVALFKAAHPEYVETKSNKDRLIGYLNKHEMALTKKNLEIALADLRDDGLIILQAPKHEVPAPPVADPAPVVPPASNAPAQVPAIPAPATTDSPISEQPTVERPRVSSSGLSGRQSAAPTVAAPKVKGITPAEIARMTATQYAEALRNPEFRKQVDEMDKR